MGFTATYKETRRRLWAVYSRGMVKLFALLSSECVTPTGCLRAFLALAVYLPAMIPRWAAFEWGILRTSVIRHSQEGQPGE